jgi:hypothetical protein
MLTIQYPEQSIGGGDQVGFGLGAGLASVCGSQRLDAKLQPS